jgi:hypothetical protein
MKQHATILDTTITFEGKSVRAKTVTITSTFNHNAETFFAQEMIKANTQEIVKPLAKIKFLKENTDNKFWQEGFVYELEIKPYGLFNLWGTHFINIIRIDKEAKQIITEEKNDICKVWNHSLTFEKISETETNYTDQVVLYAGGATKVLSWFLVYSYKKRHRNWNNLLLKKQNL